MTTTTHPTHGTVAPLYNRYPGQSHPQGAYLEINTDQECAHWSHNPEIGNAVPSSVWHGTDIRVPCSPYLTGGQLEQLGEWLEPLVDRVIAGHEIKWSGDNHRGRLDDDAAWAIGEIERILDATEGEARVWDADTWLEGGSLDWPDLARAAGVDPGRGVAVVDAVVDYLDDIADQDGVILDGTDSVVEYCFERWTDTQEVTS